MNAIGISGLDGGIRFKKRVFPDLDPRLQRFTQGLDAAAVLVNEHGVVAAAAEERFTREKQTGDFPVNAIRYCLEAGGLEPRDVDIVAHGFAYEGLREAFEAMDFGKAAFEQVYDPAVQRRLGKTWFEPIDWDRKFVSVPHHLAHAASTFYLSGFSESLILVTDGMGETDSATVAVGQGNEIKVLAEIPALHSLGILYSVVTHYLGFQPGRDEYKVMGLAPYGDPSRYFPVFKRIVVLKDAGEYAIPLLYENKSFEEKESYAGSLRFLEEAFGPPRKQHEPMKPHHMDIAAALQAMLQAALMHLLRHYRRVTGMRDLCMAGGVALNCTANGAIRRSRMFRRMFVQPAAGDDGSALGAALFALRARQPQLRFLPMTSPLWGPDYDAKAMREALGSCEDCEIRSFATLGELTENVAAHLDRGDIVAWFQGRMEFGPRALGNRSILADPRDSEMRDRLNRVIKEREGFRPFAPAVIAEAATQFFEIDEGDETTYANMLFTVPVRPEFQTALPAVTHVDGSARAQTVARDVNPRFWTLLEAFGRRTGMPVLLNTSFNVRGEPIVCSPEHALRSFLSTRIDVLVLGDVVVTRRVRVPSTAAGDREAQAPGGRDGAGVNERA